MRCSKSSSKRKEVYSDKGKRKERKTSNEHLTLHLKKLEKEEQTNSKVSRRKEIRAIRAEVNERENRKTIKNISKTKSWFFKKDWQIFI